MDIVYRNHYQLKTCNLVKSIPMSLKHYLLFMMIPIYGSAQNVINNSSFEDGSAHWGEIYSVDYPLTGDNLEGYATPSDGNQCAGLRLWSEWDTEWHEYLYQFIYGEMLPGMTYRVSFTYRLAPCEIYATDDLGIAFNSATTEAEVNLLQLDQMTPQLRNPEGNMLTNNTETRTFSAFYTATGAENVMLLGCFKNDASITKQYVNNTIDPERKFIYYYIDEVNIVPCPHINQVQLPEVVYLCSPTDNVTLHMDILGASYAWSTGSDSNAIKVPFDEGIIAVDVTKSGCTISDQTRVKLFSGKTELGDSVWVCSESDFPRVLQVDYREKDETITWQDGTPGPVYGVNNAGVYWYEKTFGNCTASDTIVFQSVEDAGSMFPNPYSTALHSTLEDVTTVYGIMEGSGKVLFEGSAKLTDLNLLLGRLSAGVYYLDIEMKGCRQLVKVEHVPIKE